MENDKWQIVSLVLVLWCLTPLSTIFQIYREYFFFCRAKREIAFQNLTLGYMTITLNQRIRLFFFPLPKSEYFFQQYWESEYFFRKKTQTPPWNLNRTSRSLGLNLCICQWEDCVFIFFKLRKESLFFIDYIKLTLLGVKGYLICTLCYK
jgi:hypothetical protein